MGGIGGLELVVAGGDGGEWKFGRVARARVQAEP